MSRDRENTGLFKAEERRTCDQWNDVRKPDNPHTYWTEKLQLIRAMGAKLRHVDLQQFDVLQIPRSEGFFEEGYSRRIVVLKGLPDSVKKPE